jgi:putative ABC transport system permease protein
MTRVYRWLLFVLPRDRRARYGDQMAIAFDALSHQRPGILATSGLWLAEMTGLFRFALREWSSRIGAPLARFFGGSSSSGPEFLTQLRWAVRSMRSRGWKGALIIALLAVALAANTVVFSAADSFVFNRVPFRDAERLVEIGQESPFGWSPTVFPGLIASWRTHKDVFSEFHGYSAYSTMYLKGRDEPRFVGFGEVTPGLFEMLGAKPKWGRLFMESDLLPGQPPSVVISEAVARQEFGDPSQAVGRKLESGPDAFVVIGVMPPEFRFPTGRERIWKPLNAARYQSSKTYARAITPIGKLAPGQTIATAKTAVVERQDSVAATATGVEALRPAIAKEMDVRAIAPSVIEPRLRQIFLLLCGAAVSLLLVACTNVVNLQLASVVDRTRTYAVQMALGASSASIVKSALVEGALMLSAAGAAAGALAYAAAQFISTNLPAATTNVLANRIDLDGRAFAFMAAAAAITWLIASLPVAFAARRTDVIDSLKTDARTQAGARGGVRFREALTVAEVAMTVLLLVGAVLAARSYNTLLHLPKGFDPAGLVYVEVARAPGSPEKAEDLQSRVLDAIRAQSSVASVGATSAAPPGNGGAVGGKIFIDDAATPHETTRVGAFNVDSNYLQTMRIPITSGRGFAPGEPPESTIVDEEFAKRFWPGQNAVGHRFNFGGASLNAARIRVIVGITPHVRIDDDSPTAPSQKFFAVHIPLDYATLRFAVRLGRGAGDRGGEQLLAMLKTLLPGARVRVTDVSELYARHYGNELLAASIMSAFGVVAFVVAIAGVYGVMAFLVARRTREIGVRMALGADRGAIERLVLRSSLVPVALGTLIGAASALGIAHWARAQIYGVSPSDPLTFAGIAALVLAAAAAATWLPARHAGSVDPSKLLRD